MRELTVGLRAIGLLAPGLENWEATCALLRDTTTAIPDAEAFSYPAPAQLPRNELNDEFIKYFSDKIEFRTDTDYAVENLTGIYIIEYSLNAAGEGEISDPEYLKHLEDFAQWYRSQPRVLHVNVLTDINRLHFYDGR